MTRKVRGIVLFLPYVLALVLLSAACSGSAPPPPPPPPEVLVTEVIIRDVPISQEWVGETRGESDIEIRARVQGFLEQIHFRDGSEVKRNQLLYTIDQSELLQGLTAAQAEVAAAKTLLANAEADVRRYEPLAAMKAISVRDLDNAVARRDASISSVEAAEANQRYAEIQMSYTEIRSPINGLIGLTQAKIGDFVGAAPNPVVLNTISDIDPILVRFAVSEQTYLRMARIFPKATRERGANNPSLELILADGTIHDHLGIARSLQRDVDASTGTLTVEAAFPNPDEILRPGQYGKVRTVVEEIPDAVLVPQRAVQELQGQFQVWVVGDDDSATPRFVEPGHRVDDLWVIDSGLEPGDTVVVEGFQRLRDGMTIIPKPLES